MCLPGTAETVREQVAQEGPPRVDRRTVPHEGTGVALGTRGTRLQDLTHTFAAGFPLFVPGTGPERETIADYATEGFYAQRWRIGEHSGTHLDAPGHFVPGGRLAPDITPRELIVPIVVVDISERAKEDPDATVEVDDLIRLERRDGRIPDGALVAMDSGWADKVGDPLEFKGGDALPNYHFTGFSEAATVWLAERRDITAIGVDTLNLDPGNSTTFPVHANFLATDRYALENLNDLDQIPPRGATAYVGVVPWKKGSAGPCRVIAAW